MCSQYWTLKATFSCPYCGHENIDAQLQTHFMGDYGSCLNYYKIGDSIAELRGVKSAKLGYKGSDDFISSCKACNKFIIFGADIEDEKVVKIYSIKEDMYGHPV